MMQQLAPSHGGLPPPAQWNLIDADRVVGWTTECAVGFRGFASEAEAAHAAWVAFRVLARRLARTHGTRPIPIDAAEPLTIQRDGERETIYAGGRAIASLVRLGESDAGGDSSAAESYAFEIEIPPPVDELRVRAMAHLIYRTLRKSGLRWALWRSGPSSAVRSAAVQESRNPTTGANDSSGRPRRLTGSHRETLAGRLASAWRRRAPVSGWATLVMASVMLLLLSLVVPQGIGIAFAVAGFAGLVALRVATARPGSTGRGPVRTLPSRVMRMSYEVDKWDDYRNAGSSP